MDAHQAEDGKVHLTYYHAKSQLSFVWNGTQDNLADVCYGGYAESVIAKLVLTQNYSTLPLEVAFKYFKNECDVFVEKMGYNVSS